MRRIQKDSEATEELSGTSCASRRHFEIAEDLLFLGAVFAHFASARTVEHCRERGRSCLRAKALLSSQAMGSGRPCHSRRKWQRPGGQVTMSASCKAHPNSARAATGIAFVP